MGDSPPKFRRSLDSGEGDIRPERGDLSGERGGERELRRPPRARPGFENDCRPSDGAAKGSMGEFSGFGGMDAKRASASGRAIRSGLERLGAPDERRRD